MRYWITTYEIIFSINTNKLEIEIKATFRLVPSGKMLVSKQNSNLKTCISSGGQTKKHLPVNYSTHHLDSLMQFAGHTWAM